MQDQSLPDIPENTPVLDRHGNPIGSVARVYHPVPAVVHRDVAPETPDAVETMFREQPPVIDEPYLRVRPAASGQPDLFVPAMYVMQATAAGVTLNADHGEVHDLGWDRRPAFAREE